jgi:hypothetical protein
VGFGHNCVLAYCATGCYNDIAGQNLVAVRCVSSNVSLWLGVDGTVTDVADGDALGGQGPLSILKFAALEYSQQNTQKLHFYFM